MEEIKSILTLPLWGLGAACSLGLFMCTLKFFGKLGERFLDIIDGKDLREILYEIHVAAERHAEKHKPDFLDMESLQALHWLKKHYEEVDKGEGWHEGIRHNFYNGYRIHKGDLFFDGKGGILTAVRATDEQVFNYWQGHQLCEGDLFVDDKDGEILIATRATDEQLKGFKGLIDYMHGYELFWERITDKDKVLLMMENELSLWKTVLYQKSRGFQDGFKDKKEQSIYELAKEYVKLYEQQKAGETNENPGAQS